MNTSATQPTYRNRMKPQEFPLLPRVVIAILLAAALIAWTPGIAGLAEPGELNRSGCGASLNWYWEYFFAHTPDGPLFDQPSCSPAAREVVGPGLGASQYWELFFARNGEGPLATSFASLPVTGKATQTHSSAWLYWEYFLIYSPNGPQIAQFFSMPGNGKVAQP